MKNGEVNSSEINAKIEQYVNLPWFDKVQKIIAVEKEIREMIKEEEDLSEKQGVENSYFCGGVEKPKPPKIQITELMDIDGSDINRYDIRFSNPNSIEIFEKKWLVEMRCVYLSGAAYGFAGRGHIAINLGLYHLGSREEFWKSLNGNFFGDEILKKLVKSKLGLKSKIQGDDSAVWGLIYYPNKNLTKEELKNNLKEVYKVSKEYRNTVDALIER